MANPIYTKFDEKYRDIIHSISRATGFDNGVAREMLIYMAKNPNGEKYAGVPDGFDWAQCREDIKTLIVQE